MTPLKTTLTRALSHGGHQGKGLVVKIIPGTQGPATLSLHTKGCRDEVMCDFDWLWQKLNELKARENKVSRPGSARQRSLLRL